MGHDDQLEHDERYDIADEYLEVLYKLWEGSWEDDAVIATARRGVFTDPSKVHEIGHEGKHFTRSRHPHLRAVAAAHAGDLPGRRVARAASQFAAGNAEAIFVAAPDQGGARRAR